LIRSRAGDTCNGVAETRDQMALYPSVIGDQARQLFGLVERILLFATFTAGFTTSLHRVWLPQCSVVNNVPDRRKRMLDKNPQGSNLRGGIVDRTSGSKEKKCGFQVNDNWNCWH
jgi:hypothetical protein